MRLPLRASIAVLSAVLALCFVVAGCGSGDKASTDTRALVTFAKSGGPGGKAYSLVVDRGGGATLTSYPPSVKKFNIGAGKRDQLVGLLDAIKGLDASYEAASPSASAFRYSVTYESKTVQASDNAALPASLRSLIDVLNGIVKDNG